MNLLSSSITNFSLLFFTLTFSVFGQAELANEVEDMKSYSRLELINVAINQGIIATATCTFGFGAVSASSTADMVPVLTILPDAVVAYIDNESYKDSGRKLRRELNVGEMDGASASVFGSLVNTGVGLGILAFDLADDKKMNNGYFYGSYVSPDTYVKISHLSSEVLSEILFGESSACKKSTEKLSKSYKMLFR